MCVRVCKRVCYVLFMLLFIVGQKPLSLCFLLMFIRLKIKFILILILILKSPKKGVSDHILAPPVKRVPECGPKWARWLNLVLLSDLGALIRSYQIIMVSWSILLKPVIPMWVCACLCFCRPTSRRFGHFLCIHYFGIWRSMIRVMSFRPWDGPWI